MEILNNIKELTKKADVFIDGKVIARNLVNNEGQDCSLGYVLPGEYEITIESSETVEVLGGKFSILLPHEENYQKFDAGEVFYIPENAHIN